MYSLGNGTLVLIEVNPPTLDQKITWVLVGLPSLDRKYRETTLHLGGQTRRCHLHHKALFVERWQGHLWNWDNLQFILLERKTITHVSLVNWETILAQPMDVLRICKDIWQPFLHMLAVSQARFVILLLLRSSPAMLSCSLHGALSVRLVGSCLVPLSSRFFRSENLLEYGFSFKVRRILREIGIKYRSLPDTSAPKIQRRHHPQDCRVFV